MARRRDSFSKFDVAGRLKALRLDLGFKTQSAFADKIGIGKSIYNLYEKAERPLTFETACLIRRHFGISIDWLFFGASEPKTIIELIGAFEGPSSRGRPTRRGTSEFARIIGLKASNISMMKKRGIIPSSYWPKIIDAATERGIRGVSAGALLRMQRKPKAKASADLLREARAQ